MAVSDFYTARWPDFICISAHYKYHDDDDDDEETENQWLTKISWKMAIKKVCVCVCVSVLSIILSRLYHKE